MSITVIIPAAGSGKRMASEKKKQFLHLHGRPIIIRTLEAFDAFDEIDKIILVTSKDDLSEMNNLIGVYNLKKDIECIEGGQERQDSVYNALIKVESPYVMIHDGARPFVSKEIIERNIKALESKSAIITAIKVKDTIKEVDNAYVKKTLNRESLVQVQTPQSFHRDLLIKAHNHAKALDLSVTDDASMVEAYGEKVFVVEGSSLNIKVTVPEDLILGEFITRS